MNGIKIGDSINISNNLENFIVNTIRGEDITLVSFSSQKVIKMKKDVVILAKELETHPLDSDDISGIENEY